MFSSRLASFLNWSIRVGSLFGIPIHLHITLVFFLLPALSGRGLGLWYSIEWVVLVVLSILAHELGHGLAAKHYRLTGLSIMLHGFGGFAVSSGSRTPKQSLIIALAGPAVTFALGLTCLGVGLLAPSVENPNLLIQVFIIKALGHLNILLGFLNLLPSLPFDGGQALVAILSRRQSEFKAMRAVCHLGLFSAGALGIYGLWTSQNFVAIFGLIGFVTSLGTLLQTGGVKFREYADERQHRRELEADKRRREERSQQYRDEVMQRQIEREERERLRKILEASIEDD